MPPVNIFIVMNDTCLDRLLKQRSALPQPGNPFDFPPQCGGEGSLSVAAVCPAAVMTESFRTLIPSPTNPRPGEAGSRNFAWKSESRNSYRGRRPTSDNPKQNDGKCEKKQFGRRRFELFPRSDFYFVSKFELRISNLEIWCILREISPVSDSRHG
jgi:hypothetical protein